MTDDEIHAEFKKTIEHFTGITTALTQVIQLLQRQPGYNHKIFLSNLAVVQVSAEQKDFEARAVFHKAHSETLERFAQPPPA